MSADVVHPRWARLVGAVWLAAGGALVVAALVVVVDQHRLGWEGPVGVAALAAGWWFGHRSLRIDELGIEQCVGWRRTRLLWGVVDQVVLGSSGRLAPPLRVHLTGRGEVVLRASWGLSAHQRDVVRAALERAATASGVEVATTER